MKQYRLPSLLLASAALAWAVPSEINYQGRLTDANGDAVTGDVSMSLKMFDAATGGNELYSEDIGTVTLDDNGVYSFQFGAGGASVVATDERVATTDGSSQVFNATLSELPIDGSVSISDGTYTWSQASGSSNSSQFTCSVTASTGEISAIYLSGAPNSGTEITATYNYGDSGIGGALSSHNAHWLELSMDGVAQATRERVLSVPFAQVAGQVVKKRKFGSYINIEVTQYSTSSQRAETDGFIVASYSKSRTNARVFIDGIAVSSNYAYNSYLGATVPVAAGQTWSTSGYMTVYFMPVTVE